VNLHCHANLKELQPNRILGHCPDSRLKRERPQNNEFTEIKKLFLLQAMKAHRVVRFRGSHIFCRQLAHRWR
jgi:hypothetical protein